MCGELKFNQVGNLASGKRGKRDRSPTRLPRDSSAGSTFIIKEDITKGTFGTTKRIKHLFIRKKKSQVNVEENGKNVLRKLKQLLNKVLAAVQSFLIKLKAFLTQPQTLRALPTLVSTLVVVLEILGCKI